MLLAVLSLQKYNANARLLLVNLASSLNLLIKAHDQDEQRIAMGLSTAAMELSAEAAMAQIAQMKESSLSKRRETRSGGATMSRIGLARARVEASVGSESGLTQSAATALLRTMSENRL